MDRVHDIIGQRDAAAPRLALLAGGVALALALLHAWQALAFPFPTGQFKNIHVNLAAVLVFLAAAAGERRAAPRAALAAMALLAAVPLAYIHLEYDDLVETRSLFPDPADGWIAALMLVTVLAAAWRDWGWVIPGMAIAGLLYGHFGAWLPEPLLFHSGIGLERLIAYSSIPSFGGMLGFLTEESARSIFLFMLFAGALQATGGTELILRLAFALVGHWRAGPAQVAIVSSALFGMISGSTVANVAAQGPMTIPMMRRVGFDRDYAAAIEAVSSTGGQITPPVLGLAAFLIVGITGIAYAEVMIATIVPAAIFYLYLMLTIHLRALRCGMAGGGDPTRQDAAPIDLRREALAHLHILAAVVLLLACLMDDGIPTGQAALFPTALMLAGEVGKRLWRGRAAPMPALVDALAAIGQAARIGASSGAQIAIVVATINVLVEMFVAAGLGQRMSHLMLALAAGELWPLLLLAAATCLLLGCGVPTSAAYILVALLGAPALVKLGVPLLAAHLFVFFYANLAGITPPIAIAALVAANISGGSYLRTALICVRLGLPCFLLPFLFVLRPGLIGIEAGLAEQALLALLAMLAMAAAVAVLEGYLFGVLTKYQRLALAPASIALLLPGWLPTLLAFALAALVVLRQIVARRWRAAPPPGLAAADATAPQGALRLWLARRATSRVTAD
jgi:TRAP transporter 4TM/12TM fusion protein